MSEKMRFSDYVDIVIENTPNWPAIDIRLLASECYDKKLSKEQTIETIKEFKESK